MLSNDFNLHLLTNINPVNKSELESHYQLHRSTTVGRFGEVKILKEYLDQFNPDVLWQVTRPPTHGFLLSIFEKLEGTSFIFRYSGDRFNAFKYQNGIKKIVHFGVNNLIGRIPPHVSIANIALGKRGKKQLNQVGVPNNKTKILPPTVDSKRFESLSRDTDILDDKVKSGKVITFVGRVSYQKGIGLLERTIPNLIEDRPDLNFIFIGKVYDRLNIPQRAQSNIHYLNVVNPEHIPKYLAASDLVILPSHFEGVPRVLIESLAAGTPVLARDVGDIPAVTKNTFETDIEFCNEINNMENIQLESAEKFYKKNLKEDYIKFINSVV
jgi:glycosyltransferase involved in cell wall biosynthesis